MTTSIPEVDGNLLSPHNQNDPNPYYAALREKDPVHWEEDLGVWLLTRHSDVLSAYRDPRLTSDFVADLVIQQLRGHDRGIVRDCVRLNAVMMSSRSGADHTRLRRQATPAFSGSVTDSWYPTVRRIVTNLLDQVADQGRMELVDDVAGPMAATVITELLGIPASEQETFRRWSDEAAPFFGSAVADIEAAARIANDRYQRLERYLLALIDDRRSRPQDDIVSVLIAHRDEGHMTPDELVGNIILLLAAGNVTTMDQLANGVYTLLTHPEQLLRLKDEPTLRRTAVEEILRFSPSVPVTTRVAVDDLEIGGRTIRTGQMVFLCSAAANRDPDVFPEPDRFDITRTPNRPLTFGFGRHTCLGAGLARRELEVALELLFDRMPGLRLDEEREPEFKNSSIMFRGFHALPLRF